ncbi:MAG TPA: hypothetical protein GXZ90_02125 [Clostridiales bacterium]|nr:hypothetical protein [Clostridiales bacterium]
MTNSVRSKLTQINNLEKEVLLSAKAEKVEMTLNTSSALASGLLIQRLTELYEDPIQATVRETISNAMDAVVESHSGEQPEIRIFSPTDLNPILIIKDNGIGMTYDDLKNIYSKYGASTKIDNLEQIGAYGLGAKSPLSYGTEFTVTSIKDGQKTTIIVAREEMTNYIKIIDSVITDESSGTTVSIPVSNQDIQKFSQNIDKYKETPIDKDVDLYVDGVLINNDKYALISDNVLILNGKEKIYGRVWINNKSAVKLMTNITEGDIKSSVKYLIGGWAYSSPKSRSRYYKKENDIVVELKAGIVGFNSSRDAILDNDRYSRLEELIIAYVKSNQFTKDLTKGINNLDIKDFKEVMGKLLQFQRRWTKIEDNKFSVINNSKVSQYSSIPRSFNYDDFTHEETGFNINNLLNYIPKKAKPTIAIEEKKNRYYKSVTNATMENDLSYGMFEEKNISTINIEIDNILNYKQGSESHRLDILMINLMILMYNYKDNKNVKVAFITDVENEFHIKRLKSSRKSIFRMINEDVINEEYNSILIYTKHTKSEINKMIENARLDNVNMKIYDVESALDKLKKYRAENKVEKNVLSPKLSTKFSKYNYETSDLTLYVNVNEVNSQKNNLIIITRDYSIKKGRLNQMHAWYCNKNDYDKNNVQLYTSCGNHTISDIKILMSLGDVMRDPISDYAGQSQMYKDTVHNNVVELNAIRNDSVDSNEKSIMRLLTGIFGCNSKTLSENIRAEFVKVYEIAKIAAIDLPSFPEIMLDSMSKYKFDEDNYYYSRWRLEDSAIEHLLRNIDSKYYDLINDISSISYQNKLIINKDGSIEFDYDQIDIVVNKRAALKAYESSNNSSAYNNVVKSHVLSYVEFFKSVINRMADIDF